MSTDPGEVSDDIGGAQDSDALVAELARLGAIEYDRRRKPAAERLGVSVGALDKAVQEARREGDAPEATLLFPVIEPVTDPVDGNELIKEIATEIRRYVFLSEHAATATALWALHTYAVPAAYVAPILCITSPQKRCGKTQLLKILGAIVHRGLLTENLSLASLYRVMGAYRPTLLIDEADAFMDQQDELRGIINAGHSRGSRTLRIGGENRDQIEVFDSFGPKAVAGIGERRDTITDRSIVIALERRTKDEKVDLMRLDRLDYRHLQARCAGWAAQNIEVLKAADPAVPVLLHDRAQDNWRPLLAIAELTGWRVKAERAAVALTGTDDSETAGVMLLEDIRRLFAEKQRLSPKKKDRDRMASDDIAKALAELEDRPWHEWGKALKPISQNQVARLLRSFKIKPKLIRIRTHSKRNLIRSTKHDSKPVRGYLLEQFAEAFRRYLSSPTPENGFQTVTPLQPNNDAARSPNRRVTAAPRVTVQSVTDKPGATVQNRLKRNGGAGCNTVTDQKTENGTGKEKQQRSNPRQGRGLC